MQQGVGGLLGGVVKSCEALRGTNVDSPRKRPRVQSSTSRTAITRRTALPECVPLSSRLASDVSAQNARTPLTGDSTDKNFTEWE